MTQVTSLLDRARQNRSLYRRASRAVSTPLRRLPA